MDKKTSREDKLGTFAGSDLDSPSTDLEKQLLQARKILEVSRILNSTLDLDILLSIIIEVASQIITTEAASILLVDEQTGELHFEAATGARRHEVKSVIVPLEGSIAGWVVQHNEPLLVNDVHRDSRHYTQADQATQFNTRSILGVPLRVREKTIGVLEVLNKRDNCLFTEADIEALETLAAQAAIAIDNARLYQDLQAQMQALQETQARLIQSEKLAAVGELVAGVAHELNNPLTSIIGFAHLLKRRNKLDAESDHDLDRIVIQAQRAAGIVHSLLDFARQRPPERRPVQINDVLKSTLDLLAYELRTHNINYSLNLAPDLSLTLADPYQLQQVFINLINNAWQAMNTAHSGGQLTITTMQDNSTYFKHRPGKAQVIRVTVEDDGPGIPPNVLPRIFDPFFTTKPVGEGTGLGMSVCHGIISEHDGHIWVESMPGQGATFSIELPIVTPKASAPERLKKLFHTGNARILVIDDEVDLLNVLVRSLEREGYVVDAVSNGETGLARLAETPYDLILCDIRMPGLSGIEVYQRVEQQNQNLARRLVFITGDTVSATTRRFLEETKVPCLSKPFALSDLMEKIPTILNGRGGYYFRPK